MISPREQLGENPTLADFEQFMLSRNWAQQIDGNSYPVEISAIFDSDGNLVDAWVGRTIPGEYRMGYPPGTNPPAMESFSDFTNVPTRGTIFTHSHPPGTNYYFSQDDLRTFVNAEFSEFRAISHDYDFSITLTDQTRQRLDQLPLTERMRQDIGERIYSILDSENRLGIENADAFLSSRNYAETNQRYFVETQVPVTSNFEDRILLQAVNDSTFGINRSFWLQHEIRIQPGDTLPNGSIATTEEIIEVFTEFPRTPLIGTAFRIIINPRR